MSLYIEGASWSPIPPPPDVTMVPPKHLQRIWGSAVDNIYAVGVDGALLHFDGATWTNSKRGSTSFADVSGNDGDAIAIGGDGSIWRISP